jgi:catenin alpha
VRAALQALLSEYMSNVGKKETSSQLKEAIKYTERKTQDLRRQLRKAVVDHICDYFIEPDAPLMKMIQEAKAGDKERVDECAKIFNGHGTKLVEVAMLACSVSKNQENEDGIKMVRYVASQIEILCPQVINSAQILAARPQSKVAQQNMENFRTVWMNHLAVLTDAVDDITTVDDFMAVSENHILEEIKNCVQALRDADTSVLEQRARSIRSRAARFMDVVIGEISNYEKGMYTERVMDAVRILTDQVLPNFDQKAKVAWIALSKEGPKEDVENVFIDASCLVYDGVREVRRCVLLNRLDEELDPEEFESIDITSTNTPVVEEFPDISDEERKKMEQHIKGFQSEKQKFDTEVDKWDDAGNDIVMIAKNM